MGAVCTGQNVEETAPGITRRIEARVAQLSPRGQLSCQKADPQADCRQHEGNRLARGSVDAEPLFESNFLAEHPAPRGFNGHAAEDKQECVEPKNAREWDLLPIVNRL